VAKARDIPGLATDLPFREAAALEMVSAKSYGQNNFKLKMAPAAILQALKNSSGII